MTYNVFGGTLNLAQLNSTLGLEHHTYMETVLMAHIHGLGVFKVGVTDASA